MAKTCSCSGEVKFGYGNNWSDWVAVDGTIECTKTAFGGDPYPMHGKICMCRTTSAVSSGYLREEAEFAPPVDQRRRAEASSVSPAQCEAPSELSDYNAAAGGVQPVIVDSPSTAEADDFWLHPCDCLPPAWAARKTHSSVTRIPADSGNIYIPPPFVLAEGSLVCDMSHILAVYAGTEMEEGETCEARCKNNKLCEFFVDGSQRSIHVCRLYTACESLVTETSMEAKLYAVPRKEMCHVVDPEVCYKTTLRRKFLTGLETTTCGSHVCGSGMMKKAAADLIICGHANEADGQCTDAACCTATSRLAQNASSSALQARHSEQAMCPWQYPACMSSGDCAVSSCMGGACNWRMAPSVDDNPDPAYTHVNGFDGSGSDCRRDFHKAIAVTNEGGCKKQVKNLGPVATVDECTARARDDPVCGDHFMFSHTKPYFGCRCCAADSEDGSGDRNPDWWLYRVPRDGENHTSNFKFHGTGRWTGGTQVSHVYSCHQCATHCLLTAGCLSFATTAVGDFCDDESMGGCRIYFKFGTWQPSTAPRSEHYSDHSDLAPAKYDKSYYNPEVHWSMGVASRQRGGPSQHQARVSETADIQSSTQGGASEHALQYKLPSFYYLKLSSQCDQLRLLGGAGVQTCTPPTYASHTSHQWQHKRPLNGTFNHGEVLKVSCWAERYAGASTLGTSVPSAEIACVNGEWYNKATGNSGLYDFKCAKCVQVTKPGYRAYQAAKKQELFYAARIKNNLYADGPVLTCIQVAADGTMSVGASAGCKQFYMTTGSTLSESTRMVSFADDTSTCVVGAVESTTFEPTFVRNTCNASNVAQHIKTSDIHKLLDYLFVSTEEIPVVSQLAHGFQIRVLVGDGSCSPKGAFGTLRLGNSTSVCHSAPVLQENDFQLARYTDVTDMLTCTGCDGRTVDDFVNKDAYAAISSGSVRENLKEHATNLSVAWRHQLAGAVVDCHGLAVVAVKMTVHGLMYKCGTVSGMGVCVPQFGGQFDVVPAGISILSQMPIQCPDGDVLGSFHFETSDSGKWVRWRYSCCKAGGVPTIISPVELDSSAASPLEGNYCPKALDESGRLSYDSQGLSPPQSLAYDPVAGAWCVGGECTASKAVEPIGVAGATFEVNEITDFDMEPGAPDLRQANLGSQISSLHGRLQSTKPPRPSKQPNTLKADFTKPEWQPQYEKVCKLDDFQEANPFSFDGVTDKYGRERLKWADSYNGALSPGHPCAVAKAFPSTFEVPHLEASNFYANDQTTAVKQGWLDQLSINNADGKYHDKGLTHEAIFQCSNRDHLREIAQMNLEYGLGQFNTNLGLAQSLANLGCTAFPDALYSPMGIGVEVQHSKQCGKIMSLAFTAAKFPLALEFGHLDKEVGDADTMDCDPAREGIARLFCDLLCVRDSAVRGEKNLRRVITQADHITNANLKAIAHWEKDEMEKQMPHLVSKLDTLGDYLGLKLDLNDAKLTQVSTTVGELLAEVAALAAQSSAESSSRASVRRALQSYVDNTDVLSNSSTNVTQYAKVLEDVVTLHASVKAGVQRSQTATASLKLVEGVRMQQALLKSRMKALGIHRKQGQVSVHFAHKWSVERAIQSMMLVEMDKVWWQLRDLLDEYLEQAEDSMTTFREVFDALASYQECSSGITRLLSFYNRAMESHEVMHQKLQETWKKSTHLLGKLSSIISDGEVFASFMAQEGCNSAMAKSVVQQYAQAMTSVRMLLSYYRTAGLKQPSTESLVEAAYHVQRDFEEAMHRCQEG